MPECPRCGIPLATPALDGLCPCCVATAALAGVGQLRETLCPDEAEPMRFCGDYELLQEIARGGMGVVWKARQAGLNRTVALKMILRGAQATDADELRFRTEAEAVANLCHPNIVGIYEIGEDAGRTYFAMEYVEGGNLSQLVREHPLPAR